MKGHWQMVQEFHYSRDPIDVPEDVRELVMVRIDA
jgi:hypothetical protein